MVTLCHGWLGVPRAKKLPGQAVDRRNGQQLALPGVSLRRFALPRRRPDGRAWDRRTRMVWKALWDDDRLSAILAPVDRELLITWATAEDDAIKLHALAWELPLVTGSMGQDVKSPYWELWSMADAKAERAGAQIGVGPLNRARLGLAVLAEARSLADLASAFPGPGGDDEPDPRLS
jgi:hypothetical protein